jgi:hypothetical protein
MFSLDRQRRERFYRLLLLSATVRDRNFTKGSNPQALNYQLGVLLLLDINY